MDMSNVITFIVAFFGSGFVWSGMKWWTDRKLKIEGDERKVTTERTADWTSFSDRLLSRNKALEDRTLFLEKALQAKNEYLQIVIRSHYQNCPHVPIPPEPVPTFGWNHMEDTLPPKPQN